MDELNSKNTEKILEIKDEAMEELGGETIKALLTKKTGLGLSEEEETAESERML
jgi:hypothetical protein